MGDFNKIRLHFFLMVLVLIFQASCSSIKPLATIDNPVIKADQVDLEISENSAESSTIELTPSEETVRIGDHGGDVYAHDESSELENNHVDIRKLRIGLSLGPGLYRAINFVSVLKYLERQSLSPQVVTGTGFGAIVAAMYANGMTPEIIEWNFYRYLKDKRNNRPYTEKWLEDIDRFLLDKFKNKNIQDSVKKFYITLFDSKTKKTYYFDKGNIRELLLMNVQLVNSESGVSSNRYTAAFENEVFNPSLMKRLGTDFTIGADVLGAKFDFKNSNEFLIGVYGRSAGRISKEKKGFDFFYTLPLAQMSLDSTDRGAFFLMETQKYVESQGTNFKKRLQQKALSLSDL